MIAAWKAIPDFSNYEISENGDIRRSIHIDHSGKAGRRAKPGTLLKPSTNGAGYLSVTLVNDCGQIKWRHIHKLLAETFIGPRPSTQHQVRHLDDNKLNNHISNICWGSPKDNAADAVRNGKMRRGAENGAARFSWEEIVKIRQLAAKGLGPTELTKRFGGQYRNIWNIVHNRSYKC